RQRGNVPRCAPQGPLTTASRRSAPAAAIPNREPMITAAANRPLKENALAHAVALIKEFERCHLESYPDPGTGGDPWTSGWGSTGHGIRKGVKWTQAQADERLAQDVDRFLTGVFAAINKATVTPSPAELGAMTSLAYNIGLRA